MLGLVHILKYMMIQYHQYTVGSLELCCRGVVQELCLPSLLKNRTLALMMRQVYHNDWWQG